MTTLPPLRSVCVFCGSSTGNAGDIVAQATELGTMLAATGVDFIYGGAAVGLMGIVADAVLIGGGRAIGVIPDNLFSREVPHPGLTELHTVGNMHERKQLMYGLADGLIALPGGLGTLDELFEAATWNQLGIHDKPMVLLDTGDFWPGLLGFLDRMVEAGFVRTRNRDMFPHVTNPETALASLQARR